VLDAYQVGIASLKDVAIDIEKVDQTMDEVEEVNQVNKNCHNTSYTLDIGRHWRSH